MKEKDVLLNRVLTDETFLWDKSVPHLERVLAFKRWLYAWQRYNLPRLRDMSFHVSRYAGDVTLVIYSFGGDNDDFDFHEFSILHTWRILGKLAVSIVTDKPTDRIVEFKSRYSDLVSIKETDGLISSSNDSISAINSMSADCMANLYKYFMTRYCLIIQDDGFPIQDNLYKFLGKWDYIGAPNVQDSFRQYVADFFLKDGLNGGFCLRSWKYCRAVARNWNIWGKRYAKLRGFTSEDYLYVCMSRLNPWLRFRYRVPWAPIARHFSFYDLLGAFDVKCLKVKPFGIHGQSTIWQFRQTMREFGYDLDAPFVAIRHA